MTRLRSGVFRQHHLSTLRRFWRAEDGLAAVEFALILPIMVALYFGTVALTHAVDANGKMETVVRTVGDLVGREEDAINDTDLTDMAGAAAAIMTPHDPEGMDISIASVVVRDIATSGKDPVLEARICWSGRRVINGSRQATVAEVKSGWSPGTVVPIPDGFRHPNSSFILTRIEFNYRPIIGDALFRFVMGKPSSTDPTAIILGDQGPWPVRNGRDREVAWEGKTPCLKAPPGST